jgi:hypothetical protein
MPSFADINFASSNQRLTQADMWETNTFNASFHARLNVAPPGHNLLVKGCKSGIGRDIR